MAEGEKAALKPCFDPVIEVVKFTLSAPMDYAIEQRKAEFTTRGLVLAGTQVQNSSSDDDYVGEKRPK
jgi:hypothetical protein